MSQTSSTPIKPASRTALAHCTIASAGPVVDEEDARAVWWVAGDEASSGTTCSSRTLTPRIFDRFPAFGLARGTGPAWAAGAWRPPKRSSRPRGSGHVRPGGSYQVRSGRVKSGQARSGQARSGQVRSGQVRSGHVTSRQVRSRQVSQSESESIHFYRSEERKY